MAFQREILIVKKKTLTKHLLKRKRSRFQERTGSSKVRQKLPLDRPKGRALYFKRYFSSSFFKFYRVSRKSVKQLPETSFSYKTQYGFTSEAGASDSSISFSKVKTALFTLVFLIRLISKYSSSSMDGSGSRRFVWPIK